MVNISVSMNDFIVITFRVSFLKNKIYDCDAYYKVL